ncbi:MAG: hypothetical protein GXO79_14795 [Chlorobi bacterium]|nr:hypothetical protein [Chlorobiota bacterium]
MTNDISILIVTAASIAFIHTILGPDHYIPFIVLAKARNWTKIKTAWVTFFCGLGHVGSSIILGLIGIVLGIGVHKLVLFESFRGNIAAWLFIILGFVYFIWGMRQAYKNKPHQHIHFHKDGTKHIHEHTHHEEHAHVHDDKNKSVTPWALFIIFVLGPCEPLIPILMYPAAKNSMHGLVLVALVFSIITIITMLSIVLITSYGISLVRLGKLERYTHAIAGITIFISGLGIQFLGL